MQFTYKAGTSVAFFLVPDGDGDRAIRMGGYGDSPGEDVDSLLWSVLELNAPFLANIRDPVCSTCIGLQWFFSN